MVEAMDDNTELLLWIFGIAAVALLGLLANILYRAYENKVRRDWDERQDRYRR